MEQVIQDDNECSYDELPESEDDTDEAVVHKAMGILRRRITVKPLLFVKH